MPESRKRKKQPKPKTQPSHLKLQQANTSMSLHPDAAFYLGEAENYGVEFMNALNTRLKTWPDAPRGLLRVAAMSTSSAMFTFANLIDNGSRMLGGVDPNFWHEMFKLNQRSVVTWLHNAAEVPSSEF